MKVQYLLALVCIVAILVIVLLPASPERTVTFYFFACGLALSIIAPFVEKVLEE